MEQMHVHLTLINRLVQTLLLLQINFTDLASMDNK